MHRLLLCAFVFVACDAEVPAEPTLDPVLPDPGCITFIKCAHDDELEVQSTASCNGTVSDGRPVTEWRWRLDQPIGSQSVLASQGRLTTFEANVVGRYRLHLDALDEDGAPMCAPATWNLLVTTSSDIHVELLWRTPGDINETDTGVLGGFSVGSDLDLHVCQAAAETWFDSKLDVFWLNPKPKWDGDYLTRYQPALDRDDVDGAGPENINIDAGADAAPNDFVVGVHYWDDWGYGGAYTTVRVYLSGALAYEAADVWLEMNDLWEVAIVSWPERTVSPIGIVPVITHDYQAPLGAGWP